MLLPFHPHQLTWPSDSVDLGERQQLLGTSVSLAEPGADGSCKGQGPWAQEQRKVNAGLGPCVVRGREPTQDLLLSGLPNRQVLLGRRDDDSY